MGLRGLAASVPCQGPSWIAVPRMQCGCVSLFPCWQVFEDGQPIKANPLAWWEFKDCMEYLERNGLERHPLHDQVSQFHLLSRQLSTSCLGRNSSSCLNLLATATKAVAAQPEGGRDLLAKLHSQGLLGLTLHIKWLATTTSLSSVCQRAAL